MAGDRYYDNSYLDFAEQDKDVILSLPSGKVHKELISRLQNAINEHVKTLDKEVNKIHDNSVYTGVSGIAYLFLFIGKKYHSHPDLLKADKILHKACASLQRKRISFLNGDAGPLALMIVVSHSLGNMNEMKTNIDKLKSLIKEVTTENPEMPDEVLYGRVGYLYALLFVNNSLGSDVIETDVIRQVVDKILKSGQARSKLISSKVPLVYEWHGKNYYGAAHGVAGILYVLLMAGKALTSEERKYLVQPTLENLKNERFHSDNFPSSKGNDKDKLVQWCHGAPGFVQLFSLAHKEFGDSRYQDIALDCGNVVWERGLLTKGYSLCHGAAGNAYTFLQLYQLTGDFTHLYRAGCFADWCLTLPKHQRLKPERPFSLYEESL
uniref:LanC-like protein 2 n=2 Tax=Clastoptera arizonana TaxID=38151 RepID=A0A1B6D4N9_9HEMI